MKTLSTQKKIDSVQEKTRIKPEKKKERDLRRPYEYYQFVKWTALPAPLRKPKTQRDLSKEFRVDEDTLTAWKKRESFWDEVKAEMKEWAKDKTANVIQALYQMILQQGKGTAIGAKLWLEYIEGWMPKKELQIKEKTLEDLLDEAKNEQAANRGTSMDPKQKRPKSKIQSKSDPKAIRKNKDKKGSDIKGKAEGI